MHVHFRGVSRGRGRAVPRAVHPVTVGHPQGCAPHAAGPGGAPYRTNDLDRRRAVCSACPGRRGRDGPHPLPSRRTAGGPYAGPGPSRSPRPRRRHRSFAHRSGGGARSRRPVSTNHTISPVTSAGAAAVPGIRLQHDQGQHRGDDGAEEQAAGTAAADPGRELPAPPPADAAAGRRARVVVGGDGGQRPGDRLAVQFGLLDQVGVGLAASPRGAQLGVGGRRGGVPGQVPAVARSGWVAAAIARQAARTCSSGRSGRAGRPSASNGSGFIGWLRVRRRHRGRPGSGQAVGAGSWRGSGTRAGGCPARRAAGGG